MKTTALFFSILLGLQTAQAETVLCTGQTNNLNTTPMKFEIEITGKPDKFTGGTYYTSIVKFTLPDGSTLRQGIDLNAKPKLKLDKIIYSGWNEQNSLELLMTTDGTIQSAVLNNSIAGMDQLPVHCELTGSLPDRPTCSARKDTRLLDAIKNSGDLDAIEAAITCGADVNKADAKGCTPLMFAIEPTCGQNNKLPYQSVTYKYLSVVDFLIENGAFVATADSNGETPLIKAAKFGIQDVYSSFIGAEADFDAQDKLGNTALMYAAKNGDAWIVEQILDGNPDRRLENKKGQTAFDVANAWAHSEVADLVKVPDSIVTIEGNSDGTCSPLKVDLKQNQTVEFVLKASNNMFLLESKTAGLNLMASGGGQAKQILVLKNKGSFPFTCGNHGANQQSLGNINVH